MDDRLRRLLRRRVRELGRRFERSKRAYERGKADTDPGRSGVDRYGLPTDDDGNARIVCRRHAERRAVGVDDDGRPACFEPGHPDCEGCRDDVRDGIVETW